MLKAKLIHCYYFSGTGNTKRLVYHFSEKMIALGYRCEIRRMDKDAFEIPDEECVLGLMFPVAMQSTYPVVWDFVTDLPSGMGREVVMFDTMEAFSGGVVGPMKKLLTDKGYRCIAAREFRMSSSMNINPGKVEKGKAKNGIALSEVERYAEDIASGKARWKRLPILSDMMRSISISDKIWISSSRKLSVTDRCINCLVCERNCPVGAMTHNGQKADIDHLRCISCMRCAASCLRQAILYEGKELRLSIS